MFAGSFAFLRKNLFLFPAITVASLLQVLLATFTMLALSSLSKSSRYVAILYAGIIFFTGGDLRRAVRHHRQHVGVVGLAGRRASAQVVDVIFRLHAALHHPVAGVAHRHRRAHRRLDLRCSSGASAASRW